MFLFDDLREVSKPMQLGYIRKIRFWLRLLDSWPAKTLGENLRPWPFRGHKFLFSLWLSTLVLQLLFLYDNANKVSFFELGHSYITCLITIVDVQRITLMWTKAYRESPKEFLDKFHLFHHRHRSEYAMKTYRLVNRICTFFTLYLQVQMITAATLFNVAPMISNYKSGMYSSNKPENGTFKHCVYYWLPFDYTTKVSGYVAVFLVNVMLGYDAGSTFCVFDLYLSVLVFHVWGHLKILQHHLNQFPRPAESESGGYVYSRQEAMHVARLLKENIEHHQLIQKFVGKTTTAFGPMLALYFTFHQVCGCILLLEVSRLDSAALMEYGVLTMLVFQQLMQVSFVIESLGSQSSTLKDAVYGLPWEYMDVSSRRTVQVFLQNVQSPIAIKAMGMVPVGVQTMFAIMKTSISYFVMLRTMAQTE